MIYLDGKIAASAYNMATHKKCNDDDDGDGGRSRVEINLCKFFFLY